MRVLHVGCGRRQASASETLARVGLQLDGSDTAEIVHLDADLALRPDVVHRLGDHAPMPIADSSVQVIVAWHVLEHIGRQGDTAEWFRAWEDLYRVLTPGGMLYGESPYYTGIWAWSDPTHTRAISEHSFVFFSQDSYRVADSSISPYRVQCDFRWGAFPGLDRGYQVVTNPRDAREQSLRFALVAKKPLVPWWGSA